MPTHVVIEFNPTAKYEWNRCSIRGLFSPENIDLKQLVGDAIAHKPGHYLAKVSLSVEVVEFSPLPYEPEVAEQEAEHRSIAA